MLSGKPTCPCHPFLRELSISWTSGADESWKIKQFKRKFGPGFKNNSLQNALHDFVSVNWELYAYRCKRLLIHDQKLGQ